MIMGIVAFFMISCSNESEKPLVYDPDKPIELTSFYPDSGRIREMVLLDGSNFGTDLSAIKVLFNSSEAKVVGSTGTRILVLTPRMPGDTCILSVKIGEQEKTYERKFFYKVEASVTTLCGNGLDSNPHIFNQGLDKCQLKPVYIAADKEYNVFVTDNQDYFVRINTITDELTVIATKDQGFNHRCAPSANPWNNVLMQGAEGAGNRERFSFFDPRDGWALKSKFIKSWDLNGCASPSGGGSGNLNYESHFQCLLCEADGMYYTRYVGGQIVRINPETWEAKILGMTPVGFTYGLAFHPVRKSELWIGYSELATPTVAEAANAIFTIDVTDETRVENNYLSSFTRLTPPLSTAGGHRDGPLGQALFLGIRMINFDLDGNLYVGDCRNHCIRMVNTNTTPMMVSTVIGIPEISGFKDGPREDAQFNTLHGIVTDPDGIIYVADYHNNRVRRVAIE
ncbi:hypothetical protein FACS1894155_03890 [Bacteroidia bacterium]|nr:hypothetical protein FACS1894155_03890 [Bacteroidia bacterium]